MRRIHIAWGLLALAAFAVSGQVMLHHIPAMRLLSDDVRLMYRSRHIYLLGAGIANVLLGLYVTPCRENWRRWLQYAGSLMLLLSPGAVGIGVCGGDGTGYRSHMAERARVEGAVGWDGTAFCGGSAARGSVTQWL